MPETKLVAKLKATTAVTDLVVARIWPGYRQEGSALPAIVYFVSQDLPSNHATGTTGTAEMHLTVSCLAATYTGAKALSAAVETALSGWNDADGCVWHLGGMSDVIGDPIAGQDVPEYMGVEHEYSVWH